MTIEQNETTGMLILSDTVNGELIKHKFIGYSRREAKRLFKIELAEFADQQFVNQPSERGDDNDTL